MATIDDPKLICKMLRNDGIYDDGSGEVDPQPELIASYLNDYGKTAYSVCYNPGAVHSLLASPHVRDVVSLWDCINGIQPPGEELLKQHGTPEA